MPMFEFEGQRPQVDPEAWIAPTATLIGDVVVEKGASVWYGAVLRADFGRILIREGANIQDNSVIHVNGGVTEVGKNVTVGHQCLVHDCTIGEQALIGNGSTVLDKAQIGAKALVAAGATVTPGMVIPPETVAMAARRRSTSARRRRPWLGRAQRGDLPGAGAQARGKRQADRLTLQ